MGEFLACTDGSEYSEKAVKACARAAMYSGYGMTLLHVIEDVVTYAELPDEPGYKILKEKANQILKRAKQIVESVDKNIDCKLRIAHGRIASEIVRISVEGRYDAIFIGSKGTRGKLLTRMLIGTVTDEVIINSHCPVTIVR